ncbi:hypothetical protein Desti_3890 [Desulfomonile tiedjei DSM 6799]|uniref:Glycosyltransferase RgtA/B/C/D-like domain-containing protein n=2 Tax=Desulfomonile tiedjei TaxID=2358 RepID=I4CAE1_DESTA|nr:hypothetical protein Desti_3890 [Desulfomonile tiedjei DSM 6799]
MFVIIIVLLIPSLYWVYVDRSVWGWDCAGYAWGSTDLWCSLRHAPSMWWQVMKGVSGNKAPGLPWIGQFFVPLGAAVHSVEFGLLLLILSIQVGTLLLAYSIAREFFPDRLDIQLCGILLFASAPLFVGMTHTFLVEAFQLFTVLSFYWIAIKSQRMARIETAAFLLIATNLAMLAKVSSPMYCFLPGIVVLWDAVRARKWLPDTSARTLIRIGFLVFLGLVLTFATVSWYAHNYQNLLVFLAEVGSGRVASFYGHQGQFPAKLWHWLSVASVTLTTPEGLGIIAAILTISIGLALLRGKIELGALDRLNLLTLVGLAQAAIVLTVFSLNVNEDVRYILPTLSAFFIVFLRLVWFVPRTAPVIALVLAVQWGFVQAQALGFIHQNPSMTVWVTAPNRDTAGRRELEHIVQATCTSETRGRINYIGMDLLWLNNCSVSFCAAKARMQNGIECFYRPLGFIEFDTEKAWTDMNAANPLFYISTEEQAQPNPPDFLNQVSLPTLKRIEADPRFKRVPFESKLRVVIFRNDRK